jgi:hypothetical protein
MVRKKTGGSGGSLRIEDRSVSDLSNDPVNARKHNESNIQAIIASLRRFGQQKPIVIDSNNVVRAGNGTLEAARQLGWESIQCVITNLKGSEAIAYAIADNRTAELAEWDEEILAAQLNGLLSESEEIALAAGFSAEEIEKMVELSDDDPEHGDDDTYTAKIIAPIYEPKGDCPDVKDLFDHSKTSSLLQDIESADIPPDIAGFLKLAAERHTSFHFRNIAEFYCHASPIVQDLMERSGLVIIDFDKAVEYGFVHLTDRLGKIADVEEDSNGDA